MNDGSRGEERGGGRKEGGDRNNSVISSDIKRKTTKENKTKQGAVQSDEMK